MQKVILCFLVLILYGCDNRECIFDSSFMDNKIIEKPILFTTPNAKFCNEILLEGNFFYKNKEFTLQDNVSIHDSIYSYSSN